MGIPLMVLIVEDSQNDVQTIINLLESADYEVFAGQVETADQMQAALENQTWDIVISDYSLPQFDGHAALELLKEKQPDIPFIVVSGVTGEESAVAIMKAGAHDYLIMGNLARFVPVVARELGQAQERRENKKVMQALLESGERYRILIEQASDGIFIANNDGRYVDVNSAGCRLLGYTREELLKLNMSDITHHLSEAPFRLKELQEGRSLITERELICKDGTLVPVEISARQLPDGRLQGIVRDITERKQAEDRLRQLARVVEYSPSAIMITNINGEIQYVNPKFTALNGYTLEEVYGKNPRILKSGETPISAYQDLWQTILSGKDWHGEFLNRKKDGKLYWEYSSISAITDLHGNITHFISINEDITLRKEAEEKIQLLNIELEKLALTDYLMNLYNRRYFMQRGAEELKRTNRTEQPLALLMLDIDEFKNVNDSYGHEVGDLALQQVAAVLNLNLRETDVLGRMGGEEFAVLLPNTLLEEAYLLAERLRLAIANTPFATSGEALTITITICIGVAAFTTGMLKIDELLRNADAALYQAKYNGGNRVVKYKKLLEDVSGLSSGLDVD